MLSTESSKFRAAARSTWMANLTAGSGILPRFVLRGLDVSPDVLSEQKQHGDIVFVRAAQSLSRAAGPLHSIFLWWECALYAWPNAALIGKADDDTPAEWEPVDEASADRDADPVTEPLADVDSLIVPDPDRLAAADTDSVVLAAADSDDVAEWVVVPDSDTV